MRKLFLAFFAILASWQVYAQPLPPVEAEPNGRLNLQPPGDRQFVLDRAGVLSTEDQQQIRQICDRLLSDKATPIIVVTIPNMAQFGGAGMRIETFATLLFDQWRIGHAQINGHNWNTGILLLVSTGDRRARIELGAGWAHDKDELAQQIMDEQIVPRFKQGDYPAGILAGVKALDQMARGKALPPAPRSTGSIVWPIVLGVLAVFTVVSLIRRGTIGWAWVFWAGVFGLLGLILSAWLNSGRSGSSSGSFGGGSFGGGFSGGGGASGSW
jgi:uncharacterized protein